MMVPFQLDMPARRGETSASDKSLAATLQALDGDGYRSDGDAGVSATRPGRIALLLRCARHGQLFRIRPAKRAILASRSANPAQLLFVTNASVW